MDSQVSHLCFFKIYENGVGIKATIMDCPGQTDASNCGIFCCQNKRMVITNKPYTTVGMYERRMIKTSWIIKVIV
ncbi:hypothetical protein ROZALSC1DRAFT_30906 [Rozella allomycis CSF55]|uniref:Uncharacterized protein n=1 Tax=Rozella allomycis (strain CSF55) TaxID=988480 RepID=A0A075B4P3_ROZAC|nr:hypothetical protein O9G_006044 [Rozella allomycis CSF55]RKP17265.1 hypothetical protein ROZALSC1DRAFT_30906 [Rozella allomycis CSF55]|eukprot:EPZ36513.1 hypothetical protein O9G_006044 [Rozella allomycis CSF55]